MILPLNKKYSYFLVSEKVGASFIGSVKKNVVPLPSILSKQIVPLGLLPHPLPPILSEGGLTRGHGRRGDKTTLHNRCEELNEHLTGKGRECEDSLVCPIDLGAEEIGCDCVTE